MEQSLIMDEILTRQETRKMLKVCQRKLDYLVATKQIPFFRVGRSVRFRSSSLTKWIEDQEKETMS